MREISTLKIKCLCSKVVTKGEGNDKCSSQDCDHFRSTAGRRGEGSMGSCNRGGNVLVIWLTFGLTAAVLLRFIIHIHIYFLVGILNILTLRFYQRNNTEENVSYYIRNSTLESDADLNPETTTYLLNYLGNVTLSSNLTSVTHNMRIVVKIKIDYIYKELDTYL